MAALARFSGRSKICKSMIMYKLRISCGKDSNTTSNDFILEKRLDKCWKLFYVTHFKVGFLIRTKKSNRLLTHKFHTHNWGRASFLDFLSFFSKNPTWNMKNFFWHVFHTCILSKNQGRSLFFRLETLLWTVWFGSARCLP